MRAEVQVLPAHKRSPDQRKYWQLRFPAAAQSDASQFGDELLRALLVLRHYNVSEQPLCAPIVLGMASMAGGIAVLEPIPVLLYAPELTWLSAPAESSRLRWLG